MTGPMLAPIRAQLLDRRVRIQSLGTRVTESTGLVRLLQEIDGALERIDQGVYGLCDECHDPIEKDRLDIDPLLRLCLDHLNRQQRDALEQDLDLALRIQHSLLPGRELEFHSWEAFFHYEPAGPVSGDFCDLIKCESAGGMFFLLGDVAGKGIAASLLMSHLHAIFRTLLFSAPPIPEAMQRANRLFCENTIASHYATLVCGFAAKTGDIEICNAGHCPPLLVSHNAVTPIEQSGLPLGLFSESQYSPIRFHLDPGQCLLLHTDGLTEAQNGSGDDYGTPRLIHMLKRCNGLPAKQIVAACLNDFSSFLAGANKQDDLTIMAIQRSITSVT